MDWDAYVHLAFDEIRIAGSRSPQVTRRLMAAFDDLLEIAPAERRPAIEEQSKLLRAGLRADTEDGEDQAFGMIPDIQGIGVAAGNGDFTVTSRTPRQPVVSNARAGAGIGDSNSTRPPATRDAVTADSTLRAYHLCSPSRRRRGPSAVPPSSPCWRTPSERGGSLRSWPPLGGRRWSPAGRLSWPPTLGAACDRRGDTGSGR